MVALGDKFAHGGLHLGQHFRRNAGPRALYQKILQGLFGAYIGKGRGLVFVIPDQMVRIHDDAAAPRLSAIPLPFLSEIHRQLLQPGHRRDNVAAKGLQRRELMHIGHIENRLLNPNRGQGLALFNHIG